MPQAEPVLKQVPPLQPAVAAKPKAPRQAAPKPAPVMPQAEPVLKQVPPLQPAVAAKPKAPPQATPKPAPVMPQAEPVLKQVPPLQPAVAAKPKAPQQAAPKPAPVMPQAEPVLKQVPPLQLAVAAKPKAPPQAAPKPAPVNTAMRGFAGTQQAQPATPQPGLSDRLARTVTDAEFDAGGAAAAAAHFNDQVMAEAEAPEAQPAEAGDIFSRLAKRKAAPPRPPPPPVDAAMVSTDVAMGDASMGDASMGDAAMAEAALADNALAEAAFPDERPRKKLNVVPIGWTVLGLFIALVLGTLIFAQGTVLSILPGAARLYGLFGALSTVARIAPRSTD